MGNALVARLLYDLRRLAVDIRYGTALKELVKAGDEIVGAVLTTPTGALALRAGKGILLATGGIGRSEELRERFCPRTPVATHSPATPIPATASSPASASAERSIANCIARHYGCQVR
jgi:hypothetical protein